MSFTSTKTEDYIVDVPYDRSLEKHNIFNVLKSGIIDKINKIPDVQKLRMHPELTSLVCNIVENSIKNNSKNHKIDKKQLVLEILSAPFSLNINEMQYIKDQIDYLYTNKRIKALPILKVMLKSIGGWLQRKLL
jgi:hypothetical protein